MNLPELWKLVRADLAAARDTLPPNAAADPAMAVYREMLDHNELELACDALETYAEGHAVPRRFWIALADAADKMGLDPRARRFRLNAAAD